METATSGKRCCSELDDKTVAPACKKPNRDPPPSNSIILLTILNPMYPISLETIHRLCAPHGTVLRIVLFQRQGMQALVEFVDSEMAADALLAVPGVQLFAGCCTVCATLARTRRLNVQRNDWRTWDFSAPGASLQEMQLRGEMLPSPPFSAPRADTSAGDPRLSAVVSAAGSGAALMSETVSDTSGLAVGNTTGTDSAAGQTEQAVSYGTACFPPKKLTVGSNGWNSTYPKLAEFGGCAQWSGSDQSFPMAQYADGSWCWVDPSIYSKLYPGVNVADCYSNSTQPSRNVADAGSCGLEWSQPSSLPAAAPAAGVVQPLSCVLMLYGLDMNQMNPARVFNLACIYGNVLAVKFLVGRPGTAMVQMENITGMMRVMGNLGGLKLFGWRLRLETSKQQYVAAPECMAFLSNGSPCYAEFSHCGLHRFPRGVDGVQGGVSRVVRPTCVLHFFNVPITMTAQALADLFTQFFITSPRLIKMFPPRSSRCSSGLLLFSSIQEAAEALAVLNHTPFAHSFGQPYTMKLCFSPAKNIQPDESSYSPLATAFNQLIQQLDPEATSSSVSSSSKEFCAEEEHPPVQQPAVSTTVGEDVHQV